MPLTFVITRRNKKLTLNTRKDILSDVHIMSDLFKEIPVKVYLVGGIGMAIRRNHFYRNHRDLDVAIFTEDMESFFEDMLKKGYHIIQKSISGHISPKHNLQVGKEIGIKELKEINPDLLKIRLLRSRSGWINYAKRRTDFFDVFFLGKEKHGVLLHGFNSFTPWSDFEPSGPVFKGSNLLLPNLNYKRHLYPQKGKELNDFRKAGITPIAS